jgi:hypothetical protein
MSGIMRANPLDSEKTSFDTFLNSSFCQYFGNGSYGMTFILTISDPSLSSYISTDSSTYGSKVNKILLKITLIDLIGKYHDANNPNVKLRSSVEKDFSSEIIIQNIVYEKTKNYLEPICPAIVFNEIIKNEFKNSFLDILLSRCRPGSTETSNRINTFKTIECDLGIVAMEFANGYNILHDFNSTPKFQLYQEMSMFLLLEMALKTGYTHGDFHGSNIMINSTATNYFKDPNPVVSIVGKPLLIDFGFSRKIPNNIRQIIEDLCNTEKYTKALQTLCLIHRRDDSDLLDWPNIYGWACGIKENDQSIQIKEKIEEDKNIRLNELNDLLDDANFMTTISSKFWEKHKNEIDEYFENRVDITKTLEQIKKEFVTIKWRSYFVSEKQKLLDEKDDILNEIKDKVQGEIRDIRNSKFPPNTNTNIGRLFQQRSYAETEIVRTFNMSHPDGPTLPLTEES